jgi:hypothetical protein
MATTIQHRFTQGELDPKLFGRTDIDQYGGAAETMQNIVTQTQGGFKRRGGLEYLDKSLLQLTHVSAPTITAPNGGTGSNANDLSAATALTTTNNVSTTDPYVVVKYDLGSAQTIGVVYIYGLALTVSGTSSQFCVQVSSDDVTYTSVGAALTLTTTAKNYSRRVEGSYRYVRLARIGATDLTTNKVTLTDFNVYTQATNSATRLINFEFNTDQSYMLWITDKNIGVYLDGVHQVDVYSSTLTSARLADMNWAQSADTLIIFHEDINPILVQRQGADDYWTSAALTFDNTPFHAFTEVTQTGAAAGFGTLTPSAVSGTITLTAASGTFTTSSINQYVEGNGGLARIIGYTSATVVTGFVEIPFFTTAAIAAASWNYITGYEATWSSGRGWPICGTFHQGRLWIGGSKSRPTTAWGSRVGIYYDFALGTQLDDEGIEITLDTDQLNRVTNIYSGRNLMLFTTGAEFIVPTSLNDPITPKNVSAVRQTRIGAQRGLRVSEIEGGIFYVQNGGQSVKEFIFNDAQQAYGNNDISLLSGHLIRSPVDTCLRRATSTDDGALYVLVRSDGEATIGTISRSQEIASFANQTTDGQFLACGADYNDIYFVVTRNSINYLERLNDNHFLDASVRTTSGLPATVFTGLEHLNGEDCYVVADDSNLDNVTPSAGSATIERAAAEYCEIGLWFQPIFKDLPVDRRDTTSTTTMGRLMNINEINLRLFETSSMVVNGKNVSFRGFGSGILDVAPPQFTGIKRILGNTGWDLTAQVTITQTNPGKLNILALSKRIIEGK